MTDEQRKKLCAEAIERAGFDYGVQIAPSLNWVRVQETVNGHSVSYYKPMLGIQLILVPGWVAPIEEDDDGDNRTDTTRDEPDNQG